MATTSSLPASSSARPSDLAPVLRCRPVPEEKIVQLLYSLAGGTNWARTLPETGKAIALASAGDPLVPGREEGAEATACLLAALGFVCTRLQPNVSREGGLGLYLLRPPPGVEANLLTLPRTASLAAVDRIRASLDRSQGRGWFERLLPYFDENAPLLAPAKRADRSLRTLSLAGYLYDKFFWSGRAEEGTVRRLLGT